MKTRKTTRAIFSDNPPTINVSLPKAWHELSQDELLGVYQILSSSQKSGIAYVYFRLFRYFSNAKVIKDGLESFLLRFAIRHGKKKRRVSCRVTPYQLEELIVEPLSFILNPGHVPVRLDRWHGSEAVDAQLHGVPFSTYLQIENLYQGYISNQNNSDAFYSLAEFLYPGLKKKHVTDVFVFGVLQWVVQIKQLFAQMWPNFFKPVSGDVDTPSMLEIMNNEIRALTGGDVTKEQEIFDTDCWRALTELNFKAKEAEELNSQLSKSRK